MYRNINQALLDWKNKKNRMPLVLNGARQVGKTYSIKEFGQTQFRNMVYVNLEINKKVNDFFQGDLIPKNIIQFLEIFTEIKIDPAETLIVFDEIQSCPRALLSLKSFSEEAPEYHIIAAGSLLGVAINREQFSFPVGKVDELIMFPMDFGEFLLALQKEQLHQVIKSHFDSLSSLNEVLHAEAIEMYKLYLIIGGMPAAVTAYLNTNSLLESREIHHKILNEYTADMAKYANGATAVKIRACYNSIPVQLSKENSKFQYKTVQKGGTATIFGEAIDWLIFSGTALKCNKVDHGFIPLKAYINMSDFKLYMSDIGLLTTQSNMPIQLILSDYNSDIPFLGMICENYIAQSFAAKKIDLLYWKNNNTAELDFVIQKNEIIIPVEVKKGQRTKSTSFNLFMNQYKCEYGIRFSIKNFDYENRIKSIPFYAAHLV